MGVVVWMRKYTGSRHALCLRPDTEPVSHTADSNAETNGL